MPNGTLAAVRLSHMVFTVTPLDQVRRPGGVGCRLLACLGCPAPLPHFDSLQDQYWLLTCSPHPCSPACLQNRKLIALAKFNLDIAPPPA